MEKECPHKDVCPGCVHKLCSIPSQFWKAFSHFREKGLNLPLIIGPDYGWRIRSKLAVRDGKFGLFKMHSHDVVQIPFCSAHHPKINSSFMCIREQFLKEKLSSYNEEKREGDLRYISAVLERDGGKVQITFVLNARRDDESKIERWKSFCQRLYEKNSQFHSFFLNFQPLPTNAIFGKDFLHIVGKEVLWEEILGYKIPYAPSHFGQANLFLFERLIEEIKERIPPQARVIELYGGCGVIGICLVDRCKKVTITEREKGAEASFLLAKGALPQALQEKIAFFHTPSEASFSLFEDHSVAIVDPPRKGLDNSVKKALSDSQISLLFYISCNFASFLRDEKDLEDGGFILKEGIGFRFFPGTDHLELLSVFEKRSG
jgi:23S rRNA (uracil1939-C5)-methyltransferase